MRSLSDRAVLRARKKRKRLVLASRIILGVSLVWILLSTLNLLGSFSGEVGTYAPLISVVTIVLGALFNRPKPYSAWICFLGMAVLFAVGSSLRTSMGTLGQLTSDRSLIPDALTFGGYLLAGIGLILLSRKNARRLDADGFIDAGVLAAAVMLTAWVYLIEPTLEGEGVPLKLRLIITLYAPTSVFLVALTVNYASGSKLSTSAASTRYLISALACLFVGDVIYMLVDTGFTHIPTFIADIPYALAFILFPLGALHPTVNEIPPSEPVEEYADPSWKRLGLVAIGLVFPVIIIFTESNISTEDQVVIAVLLLVLTALAVVKLFRALMAQKEAQSKLRYQATHDDLTGLPNRKYAMKFLDDALNEARLKRSPLSVMFLDLDRFKYVNDTLGHGAGDALIREVGKRLRERVQMPFMVARLGGDEFVVALPGSDIRSALRVGEDIQKALSEPFSIGKLKINTGVTIGLAAYNQDISTTGASLVEAADTALYYGKERGRGQVCVFDSVMQEKAETRARIETALRGALERDELSVTFQPIIEAATNRPSGAEALVRWSHPQLGSVSPADFIPIAEETGVIVNIGRWVLKKACLQAASWRQEVDADIRVSVNVSARQLTEPSFFHDVQAALNEAGLPGNALDLEITESLLVAALTQVAGTLDHLRDIGVTLSVDDFGTGYSSLAYLKRFPVNHIKIDKSFVAGVTAPGSSDPALIEAIVVMSTGLGMKVVAEGVETIEHVEKLKELNVTYFQGYYYSKPLPQEEVNHWFKKFIEEG